MRCTPPPERRDTAFALILTALFGACILLSIIIPSQICLARGGEAEEMNLSSDTALSKLREGNESPAQEGIPVHVYITNNDNEKLDVSLFIDSELIDHKSISSGSDQKMDRYLLEKGRHTFKITWWDEDVKSSFEVEETRDITAETSVHLYTILNDKPEEYEITVNLVNENSRELEAFLYADGSFKKSKKVGKESSAELGKIKLKEGIHNLSVRWQDDDTKIEYEKTKKLMVKRDEAIIFYAPKGVSFEAKNASSTAMDSSPGDGNKKASTTNEKIDKEDSAYKADDSSKNASKSNSSSAEVDDEKEGAKEVAIEKRGAKEDAIEKGDETSSRHESGPAASIGNFQPDNSKGKNPPAKNANSMIGGSLEDENRLYIYAALIMLTIYLLLRH
ncbi:MAG: hypothetical protein WAV83_09880 [Methanothrix sp.]|uniref:hypothetical protein n=1 Tax=Methanothrix sp. TaxID=90426 RepID=UPI003BAFA5D2